MSKGIIGRNKDEMSGFRIENFDLEYEVDESRLREETLHPAFVEGLRGVGHVGLLASNHLIRELDFEKVANVYSTHFAEPFSRGKTPGVVYSEGDTVKLHFNELFYSSEQDLFVYRGHYQGDYCEYYYGHANMMMDFCEKYGVDSVYTLGGLGIGVEKEEPETRAVITQQEQVSRIRPHAEIHDGKENRPAVTGLSGLLIGLAEKNDMEAVSLLGETHGSYPDAKAAKSVLRSLSGLLKFDIDLSELDDIAEELEEKKEKFKRKMEALRGRRGEERGDRRYVG